MFAVAVAVDYNSLRLVRFDVPTPQANAVFSAKLNFLIAQPKVFRSGVRCLMHKMQRRKHREQSQAADYADSNQSSSQSRFTRVGET